MENLAQELSERLQTKIAFVIPLFNGIPVPESTVVTWIIMAIVILASAILTRKLRQIPQGAQIFLELFVGFFNQFAKNNLGEKGKAYAPYLGTIGIYLALSNTIGIFGFTPPTKDFNVTAGLALMSMFVIYGSSFRYHGWKGFWHKMVQPMPLIAPLNVMEVIIRPLSLCMRLFGNVLGAFVVMELVKAVAPFIIPIPLSLYFDIFDGVLQTIVFVFLTTLFIKEAIE